MPWRETRDPYRIWVSEIMLQQTQVATVIPYYHRFVDRFPTVSELAKAPLDEVLKLWEGLGYYSRARNLHAAAKTIIDEGFTQLPVTPDALKRLPGIGDYTAAAVLSIANGTTLPAVDGNVKRVIARLKKVADPINVSASFKVYKNLAEGLLYRKDAGNYNQAMMELGALICKPKQPDCDNCPISSECEAYKTGTVLSYPVVNQRSAVPTYQISVGVVRRSDTLLITRRSEQGLLGGLWEFPGGKIKQGESAQHACIREIEEETGLKVDVVDHLATVKHAYTHFKIVMQVFVCRYLSGDIRLEGPTDYAWITPEQFTHYAFPKANHKFIPRLKQWLLQTADEASPGGLSE